MITSVRLIGWLCLILLIATSCWEARKRNQKPNIIIILADDLGYADVGFHGSDIETPNIDLIATEGVRLENFYSAPMCSPTRAGLMTGRYPIRFGMMRAVIPPYRDFGLNPNEETLPEMLGTVGYERRGCFGKWHLGHLQEKWLPLNQGFTHFMGCYNGAIDYFTHEREGQTDWHRNHKTIKVPGYATDLIADEAIRFIQETPGNEPYFAYIPFTAPHSPFQAKDEDVAKYTHRPEGKKRTYAAMVHNLDQNIGRILEAINARGDLSNTFIIFFSDNGGVKNVGDNTPMRGNKLTVFEGGIRVVGAALWPKGGISGGRVIDDHMGYIDIFPTIEAIVNDSQKESGLLDGLNVLSSMQGKGQPGSRSWFTYLDQNPSKVERLAVHQDGWKLIVERNAPDNTKSIREKQFLYSHNGRYLEDSGFQSSNPAKVSELHRQIEDFMELKQTTQINRYYDGKKEFKAPIDWIIELE